MASSFHRDEIERKPNYELKSGRMEGNTEIIRKYEETIKRLLQQLRSVCQERDEARHQIQVLLRKLQPCTPQDPSNKSSISTKGCPDITSKSDSFPSHSYDLSLASDRTETKDTDNYVGPSRDINMVDRLRQVVGKPLPQKGRLLRTVAEAGPLLHTLLLAPIPRWQNPPPFDTDNEKVHDVIPTSLSLAFPGNSRVSSASVDVDSDAMHINHLLTGKKRRLL